MVAPNKVLTAAHCVLDLDDESGRILPPNSIGISTDTDSNIIARNKSIQAPFFIGDLIEIATQLASDYDPNSSGISTVVKNKILEVGLRDLAIIELDRNTSLPTLPVATGLLPERKDVYSIFGYGITNPKGFTTTVFVHSGQMRVNEIGVDNVTAIFESDGSNTCKGDSGGAALNLTSAGQLAVFAVTSLGFDDCQPKETSVFAHTAGRSVEFLMSAIGGSGFL